MNATRNARHESINRRRFNMFIDVSLRENCADNEEELIKKVKRNSIQEVSKRFMNMGIDLFASISFVLHLRALNNLRESAESDVHPLRP